ncbi:hypothetical protein C0992_008239 [Termitomyces sp. T32_za158]|nr:hypothetical protein C0992_008239 [Termitomyces sp. T32_za158]
MPPGTVTIVDVTETLYEDFRDDADYFKGRISLPNEPSCEVLIKMLSSQDSQTYSQTLENYIREAQFYQDHLCGDNAFYGNGVPRTYGCYETKLTWDGDIPVDCACVVLQYPGSSWNLAWSTGAGLTDFGYDTNITCLDAKPFFMNFFQARKHICPDKPEDFKRPTQFSSIDANHLKCTELGDFIEELQNYVTPSVFQWKNSGSMRSRCGNFSVQIGLHIIEEKLQKWVTHLLRFTRQSMA